MAFNSLPIELNEHIAGYLIKDKDVLSFFLVCRATHAVSESIRCGLWRKMFLRKFDATEGMSGQEVKAKYMHWSKTLRRGVNWQMGHEHSEIKVLECLMHIVLGAYADVPVGRKANEMSRNLIEIRRYVRRSGILGNVLNVSYHERTFNPRLKTLQLLLTHFQLDLSLPLPYHAFTYSQKAVYGHPDKCRMFKGNNYSKVNIDFIMHTANFFKHHMTRPKVHTLYELFSGLQDHQKPKAWDSKLHQGPGVTRLGKHWLGSYAYLHQPHDMRQIRSMAPNESLFTDSIDYQDGFQTLNLDFSPAANRTPWPKTYESHLKGLPPVKLCKQLDKLQQPEPRLNVTSFLAWGPTLNPEATLQSPPASPGVVRQTITYPVPDKILPLSAPLTPPATSAKLNSHYRQFSGSGTDAESFQCNGILHPLPPQNGIPGWHRITMMKDFNAAAASPSHSSSSPSSSSDGSTTPSSQPWSAAFTDSSPTSSPSTTSASEWPYPLDRPVSSNDAGDTRSAHILDEDADVDNSCWAYEGVVLPGGKIILGRWWSPVQDEADEMICMGPFIFWEVDEA